MRSSHLALAASFTFVAASLAADLRVAEACAPAYPPGAEVRIADESAVIFWSAATRTEHFVRRATFATDAPDFGFLVPTPSKPELAEVPDRLFRTLEDKITPETIYTEKITGLSAGLLCFSLAMMPTLGSRGAPDEARPPVRVLEAKQVAGYDAVVLEADSAGALATWLGEHGYSSRPALEAWLAPYVAKHWLLTAFKIAGGPGAKAVSTSAVRMSFKADRPFYPYREPSDQREAMPAGLATDGLPAGRRLRIFFVGDSRVDGALGEGGPAWPGKTVWAGEADGDALEGMLALNRLPSAGKMWLTAFEDDSTPRPGTDDVFFAPSAVSTPVTPPPVVVIVPRDFPVPLDVVTLLIGAVIWWRLTRTRQKGEAAG